MEQLKLIQKLNEMLPQEMPQYRRDAERFSADIHQTPQQAEFDECPPTHIAIK
jgi:hypothetical protein